MSQNKTAEKYQKMIADCDQLIKSGKIGAVSLHISQINLNKVPREVRQGLAKICRRAGLIEWGLKLLQPIVRPQNRLQTAADESEICEYAVLLSRNGSATEALKLLQKINSETTPEALLYQAYCHISNWDYEKAIPLLENFLLSKADSYSKLIARVNLASSYHASYQLSKAMDLLKETIPLAQQEGATRLMGNCWDLVGHVHFQQNEFAKAREALNRALEIFGQSQTYDHLLVYKTQSMITALEEKSLNPLIQFRQEALSRKHWESVREIDLYICKVHFDQKLLDHLVFGTPQAAFRRRIEKELGAKASSSYLLGREGRFVLDLSTGHLKGAKLNPGKKIHQTLAALTQDFYSPRNLGSLFADLYPNEYFDINSSPQRVAQLLTRTRKWLMENQIPATIEEQSGSYRLCIHGAFAIQFSQETQAMETQTLLWRKLQQSFSSQSYFSAHEACKKMNWPRAKFLRVIQFPLQSGELVKSGVGKLTVYHFKKISTSSSENAA